MKRSQRRTAGEGERGHGTAPPKSSARSDERAPNPRRRWLFRVLAVTAVPLVVLILLEGLLRVAGYGYDPHFFKRWRIGGEDFLVQNDAFSFRFFPPETVRYPETVRMKAVKDPDCTRIFVLGESAAMGDPEPAFGPVRYMEVLLRERYPKVEFEIVNVAFTAINSHVILPIARECAKHEGDLWIIYMGNNEMVGPYGASSAFGSRAPPLLQVRASVALQRFRLGQLINSLGRKLRGSSSDYASWGGMQMFLENQVAPDDPRREVVRESFRHNLHDIVQAGLGAHAQVLLCTVAVNLKDSPPFASMLDSNRPPSDLTLFPSVLAEAREAASNSNLLAAGQRYARAEELQPTFASVPYGWATVLLQQSNVVAARERFQQACDDDALAFRTDSNLNRIIREEAARRDDPAVRLVDTGSALESLAGVPINGSESFYEHVHFNFDGAYRLGLTLAKEVASMLQGNLPSASGNDWASQAACEERLGLTDWNRILVLQSMVHRLQEPPFKAQPNNKARLRSLEETIGGLRSQLNAAAVAEARRAFTNALALTPNEHLLYEVHGNFLQAIGDLAGATEAWNRARQLIPHDFLPLFQLGVLTRKQGRLVESVRYLQQALAIRPSLIEGWMELGQSYAAEQNVDLAVDAFDHALQFSPGDPRLLLLKGKALLNGGRAADAIACLVEARDANPRALPVRVDLADALVRAGRIPEASRELEAIVQMKPDFTSARLNLGVLLVKQGQLEAGRQEFEKVLALDPGNAAAKDYLHQLQRVRSGKP